MHIKEDEYGRQLLSLLRLHSKNCSNDWKEFYTLALEELKGS
jgi:hypothetical protein